jgi:hypothetical protein
MKLNPSKCVFVIKGEKFLGFLVSFKGVKLNPETIEAILNMTPLWTVKEVQCLTGRLAALNRFIARLGERTQLVFKTLRNLAKFEWTVDC